MSTRKKPAPETPEPVASDDVTIPADQAEAVAPVPDRVAMVSYLADGTPAQSDGFEVIGEQSDED